MSTTEPLNEFVPLAEGQRDTTPKVPDEVILRDDVATIYGIGYEGRLEWTGSGSELYQVFLRDKENRQRAEQTESMHREFQEQLQKYRDEFIKFWQIVQKWLSEHADDVDLEVTKLADRPSISSAGLARFRMIVVHRQEGTVSFRDLDSELTALEERVMNEFHIMRLDSILLPVSF